MSSWEDSIQQASVSGSAPRFEVGSHTVVVEEVKEVIKDNGQFFIIACEILESDSMDVGSKASKTIRMGGNYPKIPLGEIKAFAAAVLGIDPMNEKRVNTEITGDVIRGLKSDAQPVRGHILKVQGYIKPTKKPLEPGKAPFVSVYFSPVLENGLPKHVKLPPLDRGTTPAYAPNPHAAPAPGAAPSPLLPYHPQAHMMGAGYVPHMAPPPAPMAPPAPPPPPVAFPPPGWTAHPQAPGFFYRGQQVINEQELRTAMALGQA